MARKKKRISLILLAAVVLFFGFTLRDDTFRPMDTTNADLFLRSLYNDFTGDELIHIEFSERVWIPFLEKWNEMDGSGYYLQNTKKFRLEMDNSSDDIYYSNGEQIYYETLEQGQRVKRQGEFSDESLLYMIPSEKKWALFNKEILANNDDQVMVILSPMDKTFPFSKIEFLISKDKFELLEVSFTGTDGRILHFRINKYNKKSAKPSRIEKLFTG